MQKIKVELGERSYQIIVGYRIIGKLGAFLKDLGLAQDAFIITNNFLKNKYGTQLKDSLKKSGIRAFFKTVADSEKSKSIETAGEVIRELAGFDCKKRSFIIAFGGGVIGDLAGFTASVFKRGINYVQVPTTLLAQVDSAIGGKTALDLKSGKNLIGAFYQPKLVFSDTAFLATLDKKQISSGMAEVIKYAVIADSRLFNFLEKNWRKILSLEPKALIAVISACSKIKAGITRMDEKELKGLRTVLNFGHTFAHAIEAAGGYKGYNHGQAVGLGMAAAVNLSLDLGYIPEKPAERIKNLIKLYGLPCRLEGVSVEKIIQAHFHDKKFSGRINKFVLVSGIAKPKIKSNIDLALVRKAVKSIV